MWNPTRSRWEFQNQTECICSICSSFDGASKSPWFLSQTIATIAHGTLENHLTFRNGSLPQSRSHPPQTGGALSCYMTQGPWQWSFALQPLQVHRHRRRWWGRRSGWWRRDGADRAASIMCEWSVQNLKMTSPEMKRELWRATLKNVPMSRFKILMCYR